MTRIQRRSVASRDEQESAIYIGGGILLMGNSSSLCLSPPPLKYFGSLDKEIGSCFKTCVKEYCILFSGNYKRREGKLLCIISSRSAITTVNLGKCAL